MGDTMRRDSKKAWAMVGLSDGERKGCKRKTLIHFLNLMLQQTHQSCHSQFSWTDFC